VDGKLKTEADPLSPVSHYGHSKRAGERAAARYADRVPITVVRPSIVLGEADVLGLPLFRSIARWGVHAVPGFRRPRFSLIHADDLRRIADVGGGTRTTSAAASGVGAAGPRPLFRGLRNQSDLRRFGPDGRASRRSAAGADYAHGRAGRPCGGCRRRVGRTSSPVGRSI